MSHVNSKPILIENCHWGHDGPGDWGDGAALNQGPNRVAEEKWCPFNFFRTSGDIGASWSRVYGNLQSVIAHQVCCCYLSTSRAVAAALSALRWLLTLLFDRWQPWDNASAVRTGPGCFAYPDMLEVGNLQSFVEDRSHFGAWAIASAPLILGHDLADDQTNDAIWPIITNPAAIRVSQSFAEVRTNARSFCCASTVFRSKTVPFRAVRPARQGDRMHPGGMVREWKPPAHAPAPTPTPGAPGFLWAVPPGTAGKGKGGAAGWTAPAVGTPGPVRHASGVCIDAAPTGQGGAAVLKPCSPVSGKALSSCCASTVFLSKTVPFHAVLLSQGSRTQQFVLESNGNLHAQVSAISCKALSSLVVSLELLSKAVPCLAVWSVLSSLQYADNKLCLAVQNWEGPAVVMWGCNNGENEAFVVASGGTLCSKGGGAHPPRCLEVKSTPPTGGGGGGGGGGTGNLQMWAKPQPAGATAVLVLNDMVLGEANVTATFTLEEVRFAAAPKGAKVLDIWSQPPGAVVGELAAWAKSFTTKPFGPHDSVFLLLEPKA
eukprot:SAG22_NODE_94_length_20824_cov_230.693718_15_plen_545_part_00